MHICLHQENKGCTCTLISNCALRRQRGSKFQSSRNSFVTFSSLIYKRKQNSQEVLITRRNDLVDVRSLFSQRSFISQIRLLVFKRLFIIQGVASDDEPHPASSISDGGHAYWGVWRGRGLHSSSWDLLVDGSSSEKGHFLLQDEAAGSGWGERCCFHWIVRTEEIFIFNNLATSDFYKIYSKILFFS